MHLAHKVMNVKKVLTCVSVMMMSAENTIWMTVIKIIQTINVSALLVAILASMPYHVHWVMTLVPKCVYVMIMIRIAMNTKVNAHMKIQKIVIVLNLQEFARTKFAQQWTNHMKDASPKIVQPRTTHMKDVPP